MFDFHRELLADRERTSRFIEAIHRVVRPGDVVVEVGTGIGVLAFAACDAGARRVYAIEHQHVADAATMLARQFGYSDRMTVIHARSDAVDLPEPADVLITETLGSTGLDEGFLYSVADANRRLLTPARRSIPSELQLWIAPAELPFFYANHVDWWAQTRFGFDFSPIRVFASNTLFSEPMPQECMLATAATLVTIDVSRVSDTRCSGNTTFTAARSGVIHAFAIGFTARLAQGVALTNAWSEAVSWERGILPLEKPLPVEAGDGISVEVETDNGRFWEWRGRVGNEPFEQSTLLSRPPCMLSQRPL